MAGPYIDELDPATPVDGSDAGEGNEQLQRIKATLKNTFPNVDGGTGDSGVQPSTDQLNKLSDLDTAKLSVEQRLTALEGASGGSGNTPIGAIMGWSATRGQIPTGWALCDGSVRNGITTPDLRNRFLVGGGDKYAADEKAEFPFPSRDEFYFVNTFVGGDHNHGGTLPHRLTTSEIPSHGHTANNVGLNSGFLGTVIDGAGTGVGFIAGNRVTTTAGGGQTHTHGIGNSGGHQHTYGFEPYFYAIDWIMYVGVEVTP